MTLYYQLVFMLLMVETAVFLALIVPMPVSARQRLFRFLSENPVVAKIQYGLKITFIFILILFVDSVNRVYRVHMELAAAKSERGGAAESLGGLARSEVNARKFYSERNMYLCGFTLFLSLILNRTYVMILDELRLRDEIKTLKGGAKGGKDAPEVALLKKQLESAKSDLATMKKQAENLQKEYNRLGDEKSLSEAAPKKDR